MMGELLYTVLLNVRGRCPNWHNFECFLGILENTYIRFAFFDIAGDSVVICKNNSQSQIVQWVALTLIHGYHTLLRLLIEILTPWMHAFVQWPNLGILVCGCCLVHGRTLECISTDHSVIWLTLKHWRKTVTQNINGEIESHTLPWGRLSKIVGQECHL